MHKKRTHEPNPDFHPDESAVASNDACENRLLPSSAEMGERAYGVMTVKPSRVRFVQLSVEVFAWLPER